MTDILGRDEASSHFLSRKLFLPLSLWYPEANKSCDWAFNWEICRRVKTGFKLDGVGQNHHIPLLTSTVAVFAIYSVQPGLER